MANISISFQEFAKIIELQTPSTSSSSLNGNRMVNYRLLSITSKKQPPELLHITNISNHFCTYRVNI